MTHCLTSSYSKDFYRAAVLNGRLSKNGVTHHIFVEQADVEMFKPLEKNVNTYIHVKPDGGEGGLGRAGTMARFPCYLKMQEFIKEGDCYLQLDSDVIIEEDIIPQLACSADEVKGFFNTAYPVHLERDASIPPTSVRFNHCSGMTIGAGWRLFINSIPKDTESMLAVIDFMLSEGFCPSEDVVLSYLLQRKDFTLTNLEGKFERVFYSNGDIEVNNIP